MPLILNKTDISPPARVSLMLLEILGLDVELRDVDLRSGAHRTPEYLAKNPTHTDQLYPSDAQKRAVVDFQLYLDASTVYAAFQAAMEDVMSNGATAISDKHVKAFDEAYGFLDTYLQRGAYLAGDQLTLADISAVATVSAMSGLVAVDAKHIKLDQWFAKLTKNDWYQNNAAGNPALISYITQRMKTNSA
ncbi:unnamed protein product, partial [Iphiclides podalirius]